MEAEFEVPDGFLDDPELEPVAALRPEGEDTLVVARRLSRAGRSRALVWGRTCARADLAQLGERLLEVSSQHEARRLARPSHQLELLDAAAGHDDLVRQMAEAWAALRAARDAVRQARDDAGKRRCDATSWRSWYAGWTRWRVRARPTRRWRRSVRCYGTSRS